MGRTLEELDACCESPFPPKASWKRTKLAKGENDVLDVKMADLEGRGLTLIARIILAIKVSSSQASLHSDIGVLQDRITRVEWKGGLNRVMNVLGVACLEGARLFARIEVWLVDFQSSAKV